MTNKRVDELFDLSKLSEASIRKYQVHDFLLRATSKSQLPTTRWREGWRITSITIFRLTPTMSSKSCWSSSERKKAIKAEACDLREEPTDHPTSSKYINQSSSQVITLIRQQQRVHLADHWGCIFRDYLAPQTLKASLYKQTVLLCVADIIME